MTLRRSREQIWEVLADFGNYMTWRVELLNFHAKENPLGYQIAEPFTAKYWREAYKGGQVREFHFVRYENTAPSHLLLHFTAGAGTCYYTWDFELISTEGGTLITITTTPVPNLAFSWSPKNQARDVELYLQSLAAKFGETATIEGK